MAAFSLSEEQIQEYKEAFSLFDKELNGSISIKELGAVLRSMGQNPTENDIKEMIDSLDDNETGTIEFSEFIGLVDKLNQK